MKILWHRTMAKTVGRYQLAGTSGKTVLQNLYAVLGLFERYDTETKTILRNTYRDHALKGSMKLYRELHVSNDDLLIYRIHDDQMIELMDIINHEQLRRQ